MLRFLTAGESHGPALIGIVEGLPSGLAIEVDAKGVTRPVEGKAPNATVALTTNPARFFELYLSRVAP